MEICTAGRYLVALFLVGLILTAGCTSLLPSGDDQTHTDTYPCSPLEIVSPIHYRGTAANGSDIAVTTLVLNLTLAPGGSVSGTSEQGREIDLMKMCITYTDGRGLYNLEPGEYSISQRDNGDDNNMIEENEVIELTLPLQQPIPANTTVYADLWIPEHGTLTISFRTPGVIGLSGQVTEFTATPFIPH